jgi:hypothetical protein
MKELAKTVLTKEINDFTHGKPPSFYFPGSEKSSATLVVLFLVHNPHHRPVLYG